MADKEYGTFEKTTSAMLKSIEERLTGEFRADMTTSNELVVAVVTPLMMRAHTLR